MNAGICPLHNVYNEPLRWTFTESLGSCVYNTFDELSFGVGWLSVIIWTFALLPQIITNCKNKAAESQSFWFWLLWVIGDLCNFTGCLLTKNLITNIALGFVYLVFTAFAFFQLICYEYILRECYYIKQHIPRQKIFPRPSISMSPKLIKSLKILSKSPRMLVLSSQLAQDMMTEYEAFHAQQCAQESEFFLEDTEDTDIEFQENDCISPNTGKSIKIYTDYDANLEPLRSSNNTRYGSVSTVLSTLSMSFTVIMLYAINTDHVYNYDEHNEGTATAQRVLLADIEITSTNQLRVLMTMGMILGWSACLIYVSSRIPQLRLMLNTKVVSGINPFFFTLTFVGNLAQCLSMLINKQIYQFPNDLFSKLPWLLTSGICMIEDGFILFLIYFYRSNRYKTLSQVSSYSKDNDNMVISPHFLVTNEYDVPLKTKSCDAIYQYQYA